MKIFCSGIGGIGLSAYAALQNARGHAVSGSDRAESALVEDLRSQGIAVSLNQDGSEVPVDADLFVYSEAIPEDAPERRRAKDLGIRSISYFQALGELSAGARVIAVCGTHGKSSTTAMAARVLIDAGLDPSVVVGTKLHELGERNWRQGTSDLFLIEACEYRRSFHFLAPAIILMTNVDGDHFDAYGDEEEYRSAFVEFIRRLPEDGIVITHGNDPLCAGVAHRSGRRMIDADAISLPSVGVPGVHMQQNAQLVMGLAVELEISLEEAKKSLSAFRGSWRRMEEKGTTIHGIPVIDDYGHHPVEIQATLKALKGAHPEKRIVCVFQPHTHDRTRKLYGEFIRSFGDAGIVVIPNVYGARKEAAEPVDVGALASDIERVSGIPCIDGGSLEATERRMREEILREGDLLLCMGAGDITELATRMTA